jgi:hypothetical protein
VSVLVAIYFFGSHRRRIRIRSSLKKKELSVPGNHWPIFLYRNEDYDPEEPWRGFCRSKLLVSVRTFCSMSGYLLMCFRVISTSLHLLVRSTMIRRRLDRVTLDFMV